MYFFCRSLNSSVSAVSQNLKRREVHNETRRNIVFFSSVQHGWVQPYTYFCWDKETHRVFSSKGIDKKFVKPRVLSLGFSFCIRVLASYGWKKLSTSFENEHRHKLVVYRKNCPKQFSSVWEKKTWRWQNLKRGLRMRRQVVLFGVSHTLPCRCSALCFLSVCSGSLSVFAAAGSASEPMRIFLCLALGDRYAFNLTFSLKLQCFPLLEIQRRQDMQPRFFLSFWVFIF